MLGMLLAYNAAGDVVATLDYLVTPEGKLFDFEDHESKGRKMRDVWEVDGAIGSGSWPEWLGGRAHDYRVELSAGRITALVHRETGQRRERAPVEQALRARQTAAKALGHPLSVSDLIGTPERPLEPESTDLQIDTEE